MELFSSIMDQVNGIVWCMALVVLCLGAGIWFSINMRFPQVRLFKSMVNLLIHGEKSDTGITPFQAFAATVGSRVGMGNIAGVATAIYFGGPGAVFWMWCIAFIGASSAFMESSLAQAYKVKTKNGEYLGGPAYFIEKGLKCKPYAIIFAIATILGPGILMPGLHVNSIAATYEEAFGANMIVVGVIFCAVFALVICGGIKRIGKIAEYMAPVMCVVYVILAVGVIILRFNQIPTVFATIFSSAFGLHPLFGGVIGSAIKTLEGYPGRRFQAGSHIADEVEKLACERAKELFGAEHANVQSYSGSTANYSVFASVLKPGDRVLSMRLDQGGHLTHGSPANWVSKIYEFDFYAMDPDTELIDYDALEEKAKEFRPKLIIAGASSYSRLIDYERIAKVAKEVGAYFMVDMAHIAGLVAAKVIPSPVPYADFVTSSTTKTFCSARSGMVFCKAEHAKLLDKGTFPGAIGSIQLHTMAAKAWSFKYAASDEFKAIMEQVVKNAKCLAEELTDYGFRIVSGGTDNHLLVADLRGKNINGKDFQNALDAVGITVNKNMVPFDPEKPGITSGVRIGLTAVSQRGLKEPEIKEIAAIMNKVAEAPHDEANLAECKAQAEKLISRFPLYPAGAFDEA